MKNPENPEADATTPFTAQLVPVGLTDSPKTPEPSDELICP